MNDLNLKTLREIGDREYLISTVYLSIRYPGDMWYETMVFPARDGDVIDWAELYGARYHTAEGAKVGHAALVAMSDEDFMMELRT